MKHRGLSFWNEAGRAVLAGVLVCAGVVIGSQAVGASEKYGMPSEQEARQHATTSTVEQMFWVESIYKQEDRLFLNGEPFVLEGQTRIEDEYGSRVRVEEIPVGAQVEVLYRAGSNLEDSAYGPEAKILTKVRIVQRPKRR